NVKVTDSRGRTGEASKQITVLKYERPKITAFAVHRCLADGTLDDEGEYCKVDLSASVTNIANNTYKFSIDVALNGSSTKTTYSLSGANYAINGTKIVPNVNGNSTYVITAYAVDAFYSEYKTLSLSTAFTLVDYYKDGTGIAFGKVAQNPNRAEFGMPIYPMNGIYPVTIPSGSDFNDYNVPNIYSGSYLGQMLNIPSDIAASSTAAFILEVFQTGLSTMRLQRLTTTINSIVTTYERYYNSLKVWTDWFCVSRIGKTGNPILWAGASYMKDTQTAPLSQPVSLMPNGIILVFSRYDVAATKYLNEEFKEFYVSKTIVANQSGMSHSFEMPTHRYTYLCTKMLYISDTQITGHADNNSAGTSALGLAYDNRIFVLRYVLGY
ncbi:MAG: hypothetical protein K2G22_03740, partial [Eubacterium sp.]|nr:hypothetical protein [Eubacterium sp.]